MTEISNGDDFSGWYFQDECIRDLRDYLEQRCTRSVWVGREARTHVQQPALALGSPHPASRCVAPLLVKYYYRLVLEIPSLSNLMPRPKWFTKLVSKPEPPTGASTSTPSNALSNEWVSSAIQAAKITAAAGELAPFPFIKGAAGVFIALLEPVQVGLYIWLLGVVSAPN